MNEIKQNCTCILYMWHFYNGRNWVDIHMHKHLIYCKLYMQSQAIPSSVCALLLHYNITISLTLLQPALSRVYRQISPIRVWETRNQWNFVNNICFELIASTGQGMTRARLNHDQIWGHVFILCVTVSFLHFFLFSGSFCLSLCLSICLCLYLSLMYNTDEDIIHLCYDI